MLIAINFPSDDTRKSLEQLIGIEAYNLLRAVRRQIKHETTIVRGVDQFATGDPVEIEFGRVICADESQFTSIRFHQVKVIAGNEGDLICIAERRDRGWRFRQGCRCDRRN